MGGGGGGSCARGSPNTSRTAPAGPCPRTEHTMLASPEQRGMPAGGLL